MQARSSVYSLLLCLCLLGGLSATASAAERIAGIDQQRILRLDNRLAALVDSGRYAGFNALIVRKGQLAHKINIGWQDREERVRMREDTIFRIFSMSKALTSIAALILFEEGRFQLDDDIADFLPEFRRLRVYVEGSGKDIKTTALQRAVTFRDLFTHTAGFTYHFMGDSAVHQLYRDKGVRPGVESLYSRSGDAKAVSDLQAMTAALADIPLLHQAGERMSYGVSIDVLGRLIEVIAAQPLDRFLQQRLFTPLQMHDTGFFVPADKLKRFAVNYSWQKDQLQRLDEPQNSPYRRQPTLFSGGGGLLSTSHDYMQFLQMLLNGGKLDKVRILSPLTVELALSNHFQKEPMPRPEWMKQQGHGLGFALALDPLSMGLLSSAGTADWAGAASTFFWLDRKMQMAAVFMTQDTPLSDNRLLQEVRNLSYQAIVE